MAIKQRVKAFLAKHVLNYDGTRLVRRLRGLGIEQGSALMVHSSWLPYNGFNGRPSDFIRTLQQVVGEKGLLIMPSFTYHNKSSREFLSQSEGMDVRKSPSRTGLLTEVFRRTPGVLRSLSPTHPLLAWGTKAEWFLGGHEEALIPFGKDSPFGRLLTLKGKILTIDAPFSTVTYTHFLEERIARMLPFDLFAPGVMQGAFVGYDGRRHVVPVKVLGEQSAALRREDRLVDKLQGRNLMTTKRLGNTRLLLLDCAAVTACVDDLVATGWSFFDCPPCSVKPSGN